MQMITAFIASILLCITTITAAPIPDNRISNIVHQITGALQRKQATLQPPNSTLPAPLPGLSLKYVALGLGTQNYTCATSDSTSLPAPIGAAANLYDTTAAVAAVASAPSSTVQRALNAVSCAADSENTAGGLKQIGHHYFDAAGTPTFDLTPQGLLLKAKKVDTMTAPSGACAGRDGAGAVPWLMLQDDGTGRSVGLTQVFRVETAGGNAPPTCDGAAPSIQQDYAALYYLYG